MLTKFMFIRSVHVLFQDINDLKTIIGEDHPWYNVLVYIVLFILLLIGFLKLFGQVTNDEQKQKFWDRVFFRAGRGSRKAQKVKEKANTNTFGEPEKNYIPNHGVLEELGALINEHKIVCVTGPAGVGKTTIVKQLGHSPHLKNFKKKYRIDLEDVNPPEMKKGETLEYSFEKARSAFDRGFKIDKEKNYQDFANEILVPAIIFIDNYEQILSNSDLDIKIRKELITPFNQNKLVHIIITSRIYIPSTKQFKLKELKNVSSLGGLTKKEIIEIPSIKLFCKIHNEIVRLEGEENIKEFDIEDFNQIMTLCHGVSNLPLGIRLIAARSVERNPVQIQNELKETLRTEIPPRFFQKSDRHKSLFNAFIWSIKLLTLEEREFLNHLTFFKNGFYLKNLPAWPVYFSKPKTDRIIEKFYQHSILKKERYEHCVEPKYELYVFARQVLEIGMEENGISLREDYIDSICSHYSVRLKEISGQIFGKTDDHINYLETVTEVRQDLENIEYFIEWCSTNRIDLAVEILIEIERILNEIGPYLILNKLYDPLLEYYKNGEKRARLLISKARVLKSTEERYLSLPYVEEAINIFEESNKVNSNLGEAYKIGTYLSSELNEYKLRDVILEKIQRFTKDQRDALGITNYALIVVENAKRYEKLGMIQSAFYAFEKATEILRGYDVQHAKASNFAGMFCWRVGEAEKAEMYFKNAIEKYKNLGEDRWILGFKTNLGLLYADMGKLDEGIKVVDEAHELLQKEGPYGWSLINLQSKGRLYSRMPKSSDNFKKAEQLLLQSEKKLSELKYHESMILSVVELTELYYKYGKGDIAIQKALLCDELCLEHSQENTMRYFRSLMLGSLIYLEMGDEAKARGQFGLAKKVYSVVEGNQWLNYEICNEKWKILNQAFNES